MDLQTEKQKVMYRFPPDDLAPYLLREWLIYRPLQVLIARATDRDELAHRLRYLVFPGLIDPLESADVSNMLRAATMAHVGYEIGLHDWRAIESALVQHFCDRADNTYTVPAHYSQRGHGINIGRNYYGQVPDSPSGALYQVMDLHFDCSRFWQDLTSEYSCSCAVRLSPLPQTSRSFRCLNLVPMAPWRPLSRRWPSCARMRPRRCRRRG
jgi:hypothetical protein